MALRVANKLRPVKCARKIQKRHFTPYLSNAKTNMTYLDSGVRVITSPSIGDLGYSTVGVYVYSGSAFEDDSNNGVSYLLKQLVPVGNANKTRAQLASEVESVGGKLCSHVGRDKTQFVASGLKEGLPSLVKVLSEIVHPQDFTAAQVDAARNLVFAKKNSLPLETIIEDYVHSAAFQATPYAQSPYGENSALRALTPASVKDFVSANYTSNRVVVVGTGSVEHQSFVKLVDQHFSTLPKGSEIPPSPPSSYTGSEIKIRDDGLATLKSFIGYECVGYSDPHYWSALVFQELLGSWTKYSGSAPYSTYAIAETLSTDRIGEGFQTVYRPYRNTGLFGIAHEVHEASAEDSTYEILNTIQKIFAYVAPEEFQGAKNRVIAKIARASHGTDLSDVLGTFGLFSKAIIHPAEIAARIQAVEYTDVQNLIDNYFYDVDTTNVCYGPSQEFPEYNIIRGWTYWNRW